MKRTFILLAFIISFAAIGQDKKMNFSNIHFITSAGVTAGMTRIGIVAQAGAGWVTGHQYIGFGAGYDGYRFGSIPVFADYRFFVGKSNAAFLYGQAGYNFPSVRNLKEGDWGFKTMDQFSGGFYMDVGIGMRFPVNPMHHIMLSAGFSSKNLKRKEVFTYECFVAPCPQQIYNYNYLLGRVMTKLSWEFGKVVKGR